MGSPAAPEDGELSNGSSGSNDGDLSDLFVIDSTPTESHNRKDVPVYEKKFSQVLQVKPKEEEEKQAKRPRPPQTCWNCGGDHSLRDCTEPKNYDAINRNRNIFMAKGARSGGQKASRYHLDDAQKFPHVLPGKISKRLRRALGLQSNQLPRHIYRMRCLGYPPGWVEEAKVSHSGLFLFNSDGQEVADPGFEDGEIVAEGAKDKYDIRKIIEYPGFNCPCGPDVIDEYERLNSKPMAEKDSTNFMKSMWQPKAVKAYKRRKMNDSSGTPNTSNKSRSLLLLDDMELDSEDVDDGSSEEEGEVDDGKEETADNPEAVPSQSTPSQARKRPGSASPNSSDSKRSKLADKDADVGENSQNPTTTNKSAENAPIVSSNADSPSVPAVTPTGGKVTSVTLGTPVIITCPYTNLPSADKFAKNICDVINFENLPDSTGKYEKMSGLIKKVRSFVTQLNSEEDED